MTPRRRRFPERELLGRVRKYESLLRENRIKFEPLHPYKDEPVDHSYPGAGGDQEDDEQADVAMAQDSFPSTPATNSDRQHDIRNIWKAMSGNYQDSDDNTEQTPEDLPEDIHDAVIHAVRHQASKSNDSFLFGASGRIPVQLSTLHPDPVQIFRLWNIYLENVNPLLRVTHTSSLQGRIIDAASNIANIDSNLEALLFGIYSMTIFSLEEEDCLAMFQCPKDDLLKAYQFGCQEALLNADFLRTNERDCLTALLFYLMSIKPIADPHSLSSLLGVANRIAHRIGIDTESKNAKCTALEAQLRRRLWWALVLYDGRIGELADFQPSSLSPIWDCQVPLNVDDSDLRPEMKEPPVSRNTPTEAVFTVVRAVIGDFVRHSTFLLDFTNPLLVPIAKNISDTQAGQFAALEKTVEERYLRFCDPENPFHFMTIWTARMFFAKYRIMEDYWRYVKSEVPPTEEQREGMNLHAVQSLECDSKLFSSPVCKGFLWLVQCYFPFPAYIQLFGALKKRPFSKYSDRAWEVLGEHYVARRIDWAEGYDQMFRILANLVMQAWEARVAQAKERSTASGPLPRIVVLVKDKLGTSFHSKRNEDSRGIVSTGTCLAAAAKTSHTTGANHIASTMSDLNKPGYTTNEAFPTWTALNDLDMAQFGGPNTDWWFRNVLGGNDSW